MWLNLGKFFTLAQISKNRFQITPLSIFYKVDSAQGSDLAPIFGDLSQKFCLRLSQVVLEFDSLQKLV